MKNGGRQGVNPPISSRVHTGPRSRSITSSWSTAGAQLAAGDGQSQDPAVCLAPSAYRHAQTTFVGDPRALELVDRLSHDWPGDGDQLVAIVREAL